MHQGVNPLAIGSAFSHNESCRNHSDKNAKGLSYVNECEVVKNADPNLLQMEELDPVCNVHWAYVGSR